MKVGVLGSGEVAQALAAGFLKYKHEVTMGTRNQAKLADFARAHPGIRVGGVADAASFGEVLVLAVRGNVASEALKAAGRANIAGKTILDPTVPISDVPETGVIRFFTAPNESLMGNLQREFPEVHFVKAFSCVGSATMVDPRLKDGKPTMFICGDNATAKRTATVICEQFGWDVADMGPADAARAIEPLAILWCIPGFLNDDWGPRAYKVIR